ncbi:MAG: HAD-IC family P-type ATPase [Gemmatimonadota bacterium]
MQSIASELPEGLTSAQAKARLEQYGANEVVEKQGHPVLRFAGKFWGLSAWMLELIALLSFLLHKTADFWIALALLLVNAVLSFAQEQRASAAVAALRSRMQVTARALRDGAWLPVPARDLVREDVVRVRAGDFVPADVKVIEGALQVDQSALTGESREVARDSGDVVYSGSIVRRGEATAVVTATGAATYFGRTTQLVDSARPKLHVEEVIARVVRWLFVIVGITVSIFLAASVAGGLPLLEILPLSLVLLMGAVPVALPVMFTVSMAVGSVELARRGVLVTRLSAAEDAANMDILCADKTGTLTLNRLSLSGTLPQPGFTGDDVVRIGGWASNEADQDPIDLAFLGAARKQAAHASPVRQVSFTPFSPQTRRTEARVEAGGTTVLAMKGALRTVAAAAGLDAASIDALERQAANETQKGYRVLAVARAAGEEPLRLIGLAYLYDAPRPDSPQLIAELQSLGVSVKMLTGDARPVAREVAARLGVTDFAAEVFPEGKFKTVRDLQSSGHVVGMTGDGVNDAPALRQAEVGIAVSGATDVAKAAASVVLTREGLASIVELVKGGRAIYQRVLTWIVNKVSRTILKSGFVVVPFLVTGKFVISALGMVLLMFMTDFVKISLATDRVRPSLNPETWRIGPLVKVAVVLGVLMLLEALALLAFAWDRYGLGANAGLRQTFTFQVLLFFALFSIVSIRERRAFWASRPSRTLVIALASDACVGLAIGLVGLGELSSMPLATTAVVIVYSMACGLIVNDRVKVALLARRQAAGQRARPASA